MRDILIAIAFYGSLFVLFVFWAVATTPDSGILLCSVDGIDVFRSEYQERIDDHGAYYTLDGRKFTPPERSLCEIIKE